MTDEAPKPKRKAQGGRQTKLTPELQKRVTDLIRVGNYIDVACATVGISREIMYRWLRKGAEEKTGIHREFTEAVHEAVAFSEARDVARLDKLADDGNTTALTFRLSRRFPQRWGNREALAIQHTGADGGPIEIKAQREKIVEIASTPELAAAVKMIAAAMVPKRQREENVVDGEIVPEDSK